MKLRPVAALVVSLVALCIAPFVLADVAPWPPPSDLVNDPAILSGRLESGLRYAVRANHEPHERVSIRLLVKAGSLDETQDERGLAHYLEHMAFNGTTHFPADSLAEYFQHHGMSFGGDSNAHTGFEETVYLLELPHGDAVTIQEGLSVLRDFADGMLIQQSEVEKERGVIFSEKRDRDSVEWRSSVAEYGFILPDAIIPDRFPIGVTETLDAANSDRLTGFFRRWYRPENMAVVAVGEIDPAATAKLIEAAFASMKAANPATPRASRGTVKTINKPVALVHRESEAAAVTVAIDLSTPYAKEPDNATNRLKYIPRDIAFEILNRRIEKLAKSENAPFTSGGSSVSDSFDMVRIASVELTGPPQRWRDSLAAAEQELRRALQFGFAPAEVHEFTAGLLNLYEESVRSASSRQSSGLADHILNAIQHDDVVTTPEADLAMLRPAIEKITPDDCLRMFREAWSGSAPRIYVSGKVADGDNEDAVLAAYAASSAQAVTATEGPKDEAFAYTDFGPAGEIVWRTHIDDLDITQVRFANGVRLNLKHTDFKANTVSLRARLGGGKLEVPHDRPELAQIAGALFNRGGLGKHSVEDLQRILAGHSVGVGFGIGDDAFEFAGGSSTKDVELSLQLLCATITDPGWRDDALAQIRRAVEQNYQHMVHTADGVVQMNVPLLLASGDPRFGLPPLEKTLAVTAADVKAWLTPKLATESLEVSLVGDIDVEQTIAFAAHTVGALPPRSEKPGFDEERRVKFPQPPPIKDFTVDTEIQKSLVLVYWPTTDSSDIDRTRRLGLLGQIFEDRLRKIVREELGAAYSPGAYSSSSDTYPGYGNIVAEVEVDPSQIAKVTEAIMTIADDLRAHGVTDDEVERIKGPQMTALRDSVRDNRYWIGSVLGRAQEKPQFLGYARTRLAGFASITKADLDPLAAQYLDNSRAARFVVKPEKP